MERARLVGAHGSVGSLNRESAEKEYLDKRKVELETQLILARHDNIQHLWLSPEGSDML